MGTECNGPGKVSAVIMAAMIAACSGGPQPGINPPHPFPAAIERTDLRGMLSTPSLQGVAAVLGLAQSSAGTVRLITGPTACQSRGGTLPYPVIPAQVPTVGREIQVTWATRACPIPPPPSAACWIVASFRPIHPVSFAAFGTPGCWLLVELDSVVAVQTTRDPGGIVWRDGGHVLFRWTPTPADVGTELRMQLVVAAPGENEAGWLISPAVEIVVGSAP